MRYVVLETGEKKTGEFGSKGEDEVTDYYGDSEAKRRRERLMSQDPDNGPEKDNGPETVREAN